LGECVLEWLGLLDVGLDDFLVEEDIGIAVTLRLLISITKIFNLLVCELKDVSIVELIPFIV
jgi:hypothetical protein